MIFFEIAAIFFYGWLGIMILVALMFLDKPLWVIFISVIVFITLWGLGLWFGLGYYFAPGVPF